MTATDPPESSSLSHCSLPPSAESTAKGDDERAQSESEFRFIHASDFRLDTPCHGVLDLPSELRDPVRRRAVHRRRARVRMQ